MEHDVTPVTYMNGLAAEIRACMARVGMSRQGLAEATDIPASTLHKKLRRENPNVLTVGELERIAAALDLTVSELTRRAEAVA